jgi:signal transduction histidine kinase
MTATAELEELKGLQKIRWTYLSFLLIYLSVSVLFSIYIARKFSKEVSFLKDRIIDYVKSDFTKGNLFPYSESKYEINILSSNLNIMEKHISRQMVEQKETNKELQTFIYRASHDLKGPLASIHGLTTLVRMDQTEDELLKNLELIDASCYRLSNIVEELSLINTIKEGTLEFNAIKINELVAKVIKSFKVSDSIEHLVFSTEFDLKTSVYSDERLLKIILCNLIEYRIQNSNLNSGYQYIKIRVSQETEDMTRIDIEDNGVGIKKETQEKIFEMFFRDTLLANASGLGLHLVKNSVKRLQGAVKLSSDKTNGTLISVFLPNNVELKKIEERLIYQEKKKVQNAELTLNYF